MTARMEHIVLTVVTVCSGTVMLIGVAALNLALVITFGCFLLVAVIWDSLPRARSRQWNEDD